MSTYSIDQIKNKSIELFNKISDKKINDNEDFKFLDIIIVEEDLD